MRRSHFSLIPVLSDHSPVAYRLERGAMPLNAAVGATCKNIVATESKARVPSKEAKW